MKDDDDMEPFDSIISGFERLTELAEQIIDRSQRLIECRYKRHKRNTGKGIQSVIALASSHRIFAE